MPAGSYFFRGSGLVGGEGLIGVVIAGAARYAVSRGQQPWTLGYEWAAAAAPWLALVLFLALIWYFRRLVLGRTRKGNTSISISGAFDVDLPGSYWSVTVTAIRRWYVSC